MGLMISLPLAALFAGALLFAVRHARLEPTTRGAWGSTVRAVAKAGDGAFRSADVSAPEPLAAPRIVRAAAMLSAMFVAALVAWIIAAAIALVGVRLLARALPLAFVLGATTCVATPVLLCSVRARLAIPFLRRDLPALRRARPWMIATLSLDGPALLGVLWVVEESARSPHVASRFGGGDELIVGVGVVAAVGLSAAIVHALLALGAMRVAEHAGDDDRATTSDAERQVSDSSGL